MMPLSYNEIMPAAVCVRAPDPGGCSSQAHFDSSFGSSVAKLISFVVIFSLKSFF